MSKIPIAYWAQLAYFLMLIAFIGRNSGWARGFVVAVSLVGIFYSLRAENEPLWVPLVWNSLFFTINFSYIFFMSWGFQRNRLDPLEAFLKQTAFSQFSNRELKALVR